MHHTASEDRVSRKRKTREQCDSVQMKAYKCNFAGCNAAFARPSALTIHKRTHTGEKPFACDFAGCVAAFAQSGHLTIHKRTHTGEKPFACDFEGCDAAFARSSLLTIHKRIHTGQKPFYCDFEGCDAAFAQSGNLTQHKRTHTGQKPFTCSFEGCDAAFAHSGALTIHRRIHTGQKPFTCSFEGCDAAFVDSGDLSRHKRMHTGEKPFRCHFPDCGRVFSYRTSRSTHERFYHDKARQETYLKKKEEWVVAFCRRHGLLYDRELHITYRGCGELDTWARVDFVFYKEDHIVILSVDEFQHQDYEIRCDVARMSKVVCAIRQAGDMRSILWLRFNPDAFSVNHERRRVLMKQREQALIDHIQRSPAYLGESSVAVCYLYYDAVEQHGRMVPEVLLSPEYDRAWSDVVGGAVIE